jgi:hypothetical protein
LGSGGGVGCFSEKLVKKKSQKWREMKAHISLLSNDVPTHPYFTKVGVDSRHSFLVIFNIVIFIDGLTHPYFTKV